MSRVYGNKQRIRNQRRNRRDVERKAQIDRGHRAQQEIVRSLTGVEAFPLGKCTQGRVVLANVPYRDGMGSKIRPVVVVRSNDRHTVTVLRCTTKGASAPTGSLVQIIDLGNSGLSRPTWVDLAPIEIERRFLIQEEGHLSTEDEARIFGETAVGRLVGSHRAAA